jgi:hypothetical protein
MVTCPEEALPANEEWENQPLRTRIMFFTGTRPVQGTAGMSTARGTVEVRLTGNEVFMGGSCNYARVPAEARVRVTPAQGSAVNTDFIPFNFKVYSRVRQSQVAGAEGNFCIGTQSASLTFLPQDGTNGVELQSFVHGLNLYVPAPTP